MNEMHVGDFFHIMCTAFKSFYAISNVRFILFSLSLTITVSFVELSSNSSKKISTNDLILIEYHVSKSYGYVIVNQQNVNVTHHNEYL